MKRMDFNVWAAVCRRIHAAGNLGMAMLMAVRTAVSITESAAERMAVGTAVGVVFCMAVGLASCSSSDDEGSKIDVKEYLAGKEWNVNSTNGTYSFYKNHMVYYEDSPSFSSSGLAGQPNIGFGYWMMNGDKLTTQFTIGRPTGFDVSNLLNGTLSGIHLEENNTMTGSGTSINIDQRPFIVGCFSNGNECRLSYRKKMDDISDETDHDMALRGTWYAKVSNRETGKTCIASMTFNEDGTVRTVIEGFSDYTTTYATKNGKVTINGYLDEDFVVNLYYINSDGLVIKFFNEENGYMAAVWYKEKSAAKGY